MSTPWDFEYSFKTCPALVGGTLASCLLNGTPWQWHPAAAAKGPHPMLWEHTTSFVTLVYCWPFPLLHWWYWSIPLFFALQMICAEPGEGLHNFFDSYFVNPASGTRDITSPKDFPNHSLHTFIDHCPKVFHLLLCLFGNFFLPASSFVWFLTSVNGYLLFTTQHVFIL